MADRKVRMARLVPQREADREFDVEFWQRAGAEARFAAMWQMVVDHHTRGGGDVRDLKLDKSVERIIRRRRRNHR